MLPSCFARRPVAALIARHDICYLRSANGPGAVLVYYNFCRQHKSPGGISPAMEAGLTETLHDMEWTVVLIDTRAPKPGRPKKYKKRKNSNRDTTQSGVVISLADLQKMSGILSLSSMRRPVAWSRLHGLLGADCQVHEFRKGFCCGIELRRV